MKKAKILTVLGVMLAMGLTGCKTGGASSAAPESKPGSSAQPVSSAPAPTTSSKAPTSSAAPTPAAEVPDPEGHKWNADADVAADATAGTVAYKKATCKDNDGAVRLKVNQSVVKYDKGGRKEGTPEGYTKLSSNGDIMSFKFKADKKYMGKLYLYGVMDGWGSSSNHSAGFYYRNSPNVEIKLNGDVIDVSGSQSGSYAQWFGEDASEEDSTLSKEGYAPYGSVVINEGVNEFVYKRVQTLNMLIKDFVFIVTEFQEWSAPKAVAADATAGTVGYNLYTNNLNGTKKIEVQLADSMLAEGSENKNDPAGYFKLKSNGQSFGFKFKYDSIAYGELYQRGVMDGWSSNKGRNLFCGGSNGADDFEIQINENVMTVDPDQKALTFEQAMPGEGDTEKNLSPVTDVLTGELQLKNGVNEFKYTRKASFNLALTHIVIIVKDSDHEHAAAADAVWQKDEQHHWHICGHEGCNEVIDEANHKWIDDGSKTDVPSTETVAGKHYVKCEICGQTAEQALPLAGHTFVEGTPSGDITPLECSGCHEVGMQFNGMADNTIGSNKAALSSGKLNKSTTMTWTLTMPKAGKVAVFINAKHSDGNGDKAFAAGWAIKGGASAEALTDGTLTLNTSARADSVLNKDNYVYLEIGNVTVAEGAYVIQVTTYGSSAQARLLSDGLVRVVYQAA